MRIFRRVIARSWLFFTTVSSFRVYKEIKAILRSKFKYGVLSLRFFFRQILAAPVIIHLSRRRFPNFLCVKCFISNYLVNFCENGNDFAICMYLPPLCCVISLKKSTEDNQRVTCFNMFSINAIHFHTGFASLKSLPFLLFNFQISTTRFKTTKTNLAVCFSVSLKTPCISNSLLGVYLLCQPCFFSENSHDHFSNFLAFVCNVLKTFHTINKK